MDWRRHREWPNRLRKRLRCAARLSTLLTLDLRIIDLSGSQALISVNRRPSVTVSHRQANSQSPPSGG